MHYKERFKQFKSFFYGIDPGLTRLYYRYFYRPPHGSIASIINRKAQGVKPFYFLQIGGNDGFVRDPIFKFVKKYPWKGIIVEPQADVFNNRLKRTYRFESKVILENVAIANQSGTRSLYKLAISNSRWATGLASFNRETLEHQIDKGYVDRQAKKEGVPLPENRQDYIVSEEVNCMTIAHLLEKHNFTSLHLLQIDTEGYDFEIIKTIDFTKLKPLMISFESEHLSEPDLTECERLLSAQGYTITHVYRDTIACLD